MTISKKFTCEDGSQWEGDVCGTTTKGYAYLEIRRIKPTESDLLADLLAEMDAGIKGAVMGMPTFVDYAAAQRIARIIIETVKKMEEL